MKFTTLLLVACCMLGLFFTSNMHSQERPLSPNAKVSVLTCGTANEVYSLFGHTAIRISDPENFLDVVYNYGAFDFSTPNFVLKFVKGDLQYFAAVHPYSDFINEYTYEHRDVYEQELQISLQWRQELYNNLNQSLTSGDSYYTYKFIDKNCTSMVVDIINKSLKQNVVVKKENTDTTYRSILYPYFDNHFYEKLGTSIIFGKKVDQDGTQIFLPFELLESLKKVTFNGQNLAPQTTPVLTFDKEIPTSWWNNPYSYLAALLLILLLNIKKLNQFYLLLLSLIGLFFVFAGFYSFHEELAWNYNVLLFNPLLLLLLFFTLTNNSRYIYKLAVANLICLLIYLVLLVNKAHLLIVLPMIVTSAVVLLRIATKNKKRIPIII